jgi:predicted transcriptional regulator of viral defense system
VAARTSPPDWLIRQLADRQHGIVTRGQLLERGFTRHQIQQRIRMGWLVVVHPGVYRVGSGRVTHRGRWLAAVLACGSDAVLSHLSAAALWRLIAPVVGPVHVTTQNQTRRRRGIIAHRTRSFGPSEVTREHGIPVTSPSRTLVDLAAVVPRTQLRRALEATDRLELLDVQALIRRCEDGNGRKGTGTLLSLLAHFRPLPETRSELERGFLRVCDDAGLPRPAVNVVVEGVEVDFAWFSERVVAEVDGYEYHSNRSAFEKDRRRDVTLQLAGFRVLRFTHRRLVEEPDQVVAELRHALAAAEMRWDSQ